MEGGQGDEKKHNGHEGRRMCSMVKKANESNERWGSALRQDCEETFDPTPESLTYRADPPRQPTQKRFRGLALRLPSYLHVAC
eukprot:768658-Hanusia_phi.AAC.4